jgi:hypothetical protein
MSGRRSHARFAVLPFPAGVLRILRDVVFTRASDEELLVVGRQPGVRGELVSVHSPDDSHGSWVAEVLESHPVIVDGTVRHQLRLQQVNGTVAPGGAADDERPVDE